MCSNLYYGVKDGDVCFSFNQAQWLTAYEAIGQLKRVTCQHDKELIYPNELILNEANNAILDILLLAKYRNKYGNIKLKSILLSKLKTLCCDDQANCDNLSILKLPKSSYYWIQVENNLIPQFAFRAGYDDSTKQFSYIGRMQVSSLSSSLGQIPLCNSEFLKVSKNNVSKSTMISSLIGTLTHFYEYIPAIVLQLHDLSYLDEKKLVNLGQSQGNINQTESFWNRLRAAVLTNNTSQDMDFNFISSNYEVLCLKKHPATLKQACILKLNAINDIHFNQRNKEAMSYLSLPNSIRNLIYPSYLMPGQCLVKNSRMRSSNGSFELNINSDGSMKIVNYNTVLMTKKVVTYEKNIESLLVSQTGVYLVYDNNQAMRKPTVLYRPNSNSNVKQKSDNKMADFNSNTESLLDNSLGSTFVLELSNTGYLRVIIQRYIKNSSKTVSKTVLINILDLNQCLKPLPSISECNPVEIKQKRSTNRLSRAVIVNVKIILNDFRGWPIKLFEILKKVLKSIFQTAIPNSV